MEGALGMALRRSGLGAGRRVVRIWGLETWWSLGRWKGELRWGMRLLEQTGLASEDGLDCAQTGVTLGKRIDN